MGTSRQSSTDVLAVGSETISRPARSSGVIDWLEREAFLLPFIAVYAFQLLRLVPQQLSQDGWLTLVGGREIIERGLPSADTLAALTKGVEWVDQQWLAQLAFYGLHQLGGLKTTLLVHDAVLVLSFTIALAIARWRGASARRIGIVAALAMFSVFPNSAFRAQTLAYPLFVALLWLLIADARRPSTRVFWALPLLVLWTNLHGSAVLGAVLISLHGIAFTVGKLRQRIDDYSWLWRSAVLVLGPAPFLFASPYGLGLLGYFRRTIANPDFSRFITEWRSSTFPDQWPLFVLAAAAIWLAARYGRRLTLFEHLALLVTMAGGFLTVRSIAWFGLTALAILPLCMQEAWPIRAGEVRRRRLSVMLAGGSIAFLVMSVVVALSRPLSWFEQDWPPDRVAADIAGQAHRDSSLKVFADVRYADWLLWKQPALAGRVAYDARLELLSEGQTEKIANFQSRVGEDWAALADGYRVLAFERGDERMREATFLQEPGVDVLYRDKNAIVLVRPSRSQ